MQKMNEAKQIESAIFEGWSFDEERGLFVRIPIYRTGREFKQAKELFPANWIDIEQFFIWVSKNQYFWRPEIGKWHKAYQDPTDTATLWDRFINHTVKYFGRVSRVIEEEHLNGQHIKLANFPSKTFFNRQFAIQEGELVSLTVNSNYLIVNKLSYE